MPRVDAWTHEEMILVLNLYLKLPFGKMDRRNPDVIHLANIIGRTPNAVALRLVNYASYDPQLKQRGISGMAHGGKKCGEFAIYTNEIIDTFIVPVNTVNISVIVDEI